MEKEITLQKLEVNQTILKEGFRFRIINRSQKFYLCSQENQLGSIIAYEVGEIKTRRPTIYRKTYYEDILRANEFGLSSSHKTLNRTKKIEIEKHFNDLVKTENHSKI